MRNIKYLRLVYLWLFLQVISTGCDKEEVPLEKTDYQSVSSTKAVFVLENRVSEGKLTNRIYVMLYDIDSNGDVKIINSLGNATLSFNKGEMMYGTIDGNECFFPKNLSFSLIPDTVYHIALQDNKGTYDSYVKMPPSLGNLVIKDTIDISKGINLSWGPTLPSGKLKANIEVYNPADWSEKIVLYNDDIPHNDRIEVAGSLSPFINGWFGRIEMSRGQFGTCSGSLHRKSSILAKCVYYKEFAVLKTK
jgi:hypothetical protein